MLGSPEYMEGFERSEKVLPVRIVSEANLNKTNVKAKLNLTAYRCKTLNSIIRRAVIVKF